MFCFRSLLKVINKYISHVKKNSERLGGKCIILSKLYLKLIILDRYIYTCTYGKQYSVARFAK